MTGLQMSESKKTANYHFMIEKTSLGGDLRVPFGIC